MEKGKQSRLKVVVVKNYDVIQTIVNTVNTDETKALREVVNILKTPKYFKEFWIKYKWLLLS